MTPATATLDSTEPEAYDGPRCWECGGPCAFYKGSVHGWHCTGCIDRYLDAAAARGEAKQRKARERLLHRCFTTMTQLRSLRVGVGAVVVRVVYRAAVPASIQHPAISRTDH